MLRHLPLVSDARVLVGAATADDAAVYQVSDEMAIVTTVDFITPVVDDPFAWGTIAAANALSDVYAMGAQPLFALNTVSFPRDALPLAVLEQVLTGGAAKATEAGIPILGGHSVDDPEPKYGMVAVGMVHPRRVLRNVGAQPGDALVLTKPLGMGIITTAIKRGLAGEEITREAVGIMATLNRAAGEVLAAAGPERIHAVTDVTGFGLLGHLAEMVRGSTEVGAEVDAKVVPVLDAAREFARQGIVPGGSRRNLSSVEDLVIWNGEITEEEQLVLADAQTSGGLLIAVDASAAAALLDDVRARGVQWAVRIGRFTKRAGRIEVRR